MSLNSDSTAGTVPEQEAPTVDAHLGCAGDLPVRPDIEPALAAIEELTDPVARAYASTLLLAALDEDRLAVAQLRRAAVAASGLSSRKLASALGLSLGAASDLQRAARGRTRRRAR
jgi:hypothetical protein